jgi:tetratricopeptide (TPR) repeat protein
MNLKRTLYIIILLFCSQSLFAQVRSPGERRQSAAELNDEAIDVYQRSSKVESEIRTAIDMFDEAISRDSSFVIAHMNKLSMLCLLGANDEMLQELDRTIATCGKKPEYICIKGYILDRSNFPKLAYEKYLEAEAMYKFLIKENQNVVPSSLGLAFLQFFLQGKNAGLKEYKKLEKLYGDETVVSVRNTFYHFNKDEFLKNFSIPLRRSPNNLEVK